jgi:6-phosphogluconate dehydrogenase
MSFYRRQPIYYQRGGGLGLGFLRNVFTKSNLKKGAQKLLEFGSDVLKQHNQSPNIGILDATKKVAKRKVANTVKKILQKPSTSINSEVSKKYVSRPLKRRGAAVKSKSKRRKITL